MAAATYFDAVQKIYIAFYQRPADPAGLQYWSQIADSKGGNLSTVIDAFANSAESTALYGSITSANVGTVIDQIYTACFGKTADAPGKAYYIAEFTAGRITAGNIALAVLNGAQNADAVAVANKLSVANTFTATVDGRPMTDVNFGKGGVAAATYSGTTDAAAARTFLTTVTSDPATVKLTAAVTSFVSYSIADKTDTIFAVDPQVTATATVAASASAYATAASATTAAIAAANTAYDTAAAASVAAKATADKTDAAALKVVSDASTAAAAAAVTAKTAADAAVVTAQAALTAAINAVPADTATVNTANATLIIKTAQAATAATTATTAAATAATDLAKTTAATADDTALATAPGPHRLHRDLATPHHARRPSTPIPAYRPPSAACGR